MPLFSPPDCGVGSQSLFPTQDARDAQDAKDVRAARAGQDIELMGTVVGPPTGLDHVLVVEPPDPAGDFQTLNDVGSTPTYQSLPSPALEVRPPQSPPAAATPCTSVVPYNNIVERFSFPALSCDSAEATSDSETSHTQSLCTIYDSLQSPCRDSPSPSSGSLGESSDGEYEVPSGPAAPLPLANGEENSNKY